MKYINKKSKVFIIIFSVLISLSFSFKINVSRAEGVPPKVLETLYDKSKNEYQFRMHYYLNHGLAKFTYDIGRLDNFQTLYSGENFSDAECCPAKDDDIQIQKATLKQTYLVKDFNQDKVKDLELSLIEQDCISGELQFIEKLFLSDGDGFTIKQSLKKMAKP